jgi:hypothetical protein
VGTNPDKEMHPLTLMVMREIGIAVSKKAEESPLEDD